MKTHHASLILRRLLLCIAIAVVPAVVFATDAYVSPTGDDSNDGLTPATAKATVQAAAAVASEGGTIHVAAGTYSGAGNQLLDWNAYKNRNIVGAGPDATVFVVNDPPFVNRLEMQTMNPLFANFKVEQPVNRNFDIGLFVFGTGGKNADVTFSNVWLSGPYDGDQLADPIVAGTDGNRFGAAFYFQKWGTGDPNNYYKGTLHFIHSCISEFGRVLAYNDLMIHTGAMTTLFENCTLVNNADTGGGWVDGSMIWVRGVASNRWLVFTDSIVSHNNIDPGCAIGTWGTRGISIHATYNTCVLENNIIYTNSISEGRVFFENIGSYIGVETQDLTLEPTYQSAFGVDYVYDRHTPGDFRGWKSIPEPGAFGAILLSLLLFKRRV